VAHAFAAARATVVLESRPCGSAAAGMDDVSPGPGGLPGSTAALSARHALVTLVQRGGDAAVRALAGIPSDLGRESWLDGVGWVALARAVHLEVVGDPVAARQELSRSWSALMSVGMRVEALVVGPELAVLAAAGREQDTVDEVAAVLGDLARLTPSVSSRRAAAALAAGLQSGDRSSLRTSVALGLESPRWLWTLPIAEHAATALEGLQDPEAAVLLRRVGEAYAARGAEHAARRLRSRARVRGQRPAARGAGAALAPSAARSSEPPALTPTEQVVARHVERGETNAEIAAALVLSRRTVESHVSHILGKLGLRSRAELILAAARDGRIPAEPPGEGPADRSASPGTYRAADIPA
jgi:DNA-binding CsgD family transcriptional regulator